MSTSRLKGSLLLIGLGVIIFLLTMLLERLFSIETEFAQFIKGIGCGILLGGVINLIIKKKRD